MNMMFTVPEVNLIVIYKGSTKSQTIQNIMDKIPLIYDSETKKFAEEVIVKLDKITEAEFTQSEFIAEYGD